MSRPATLDATVEDRTEVRIDVKADRGPWLVWRAASSEAAARLAVDAEAARLEAATLTAGRYAFRIVRRDVHVEATAWTEVES